jgi:preprotein translocase subunit SecA
LSRDFLTEELVADALAAYEAREEQVGPEVMRDLERRVILSVLDRRWREHLYEMDYLRDGIGLRAMAQRDPLVEYQREGYDLFAAMMDGIKEESIGLLFYLEVTTEEDSEPADPIQIGSIPDASGLLSLDDLEVEDDPEPRAEQVETPTRAVSDLAGMGLGPRRPDRLDYSAPDEGGQAAVVASAAASQYAHVGRNDPCPCGSGQKYKRCHGAPGQHH